MRLWIIPYDQMVTGSVACGLALPRSSKPIWDS